MTQATYEGLRRLRPDERPFVLTRASYRRRAAILRALARRQHQRPGSISARRSRCSPAWASRAAVRRQRHRRLRRGVPSAELYTRWLQAGVFYPFMRTHTAFGTPDQEPWSYGTRARGDQPLARSSCGTSCCRTSTTSWRSRARPGCPRCGRSCSNIQTILATWSLDDQFMFGRDLLVAPVLRRRRSRARGLSARRVTGSTSGPDAGTQEASRRAHPRDAGEHSDLRARRRVRVPPAGRAAHGRDARPSRSRSRSFRPPLRTRVIYEDDGETMAYAQGASMRRRFTPIAEPRRPRRSTSPRPKDRSVRRRADLVLSVHWSGEPSRVTSGATALTRYHARGTRDSRLGLDRVGHRVCRRQAAGRRCARYRRVARVDTRTPSCTAIEPRRRRRGSCVWLVLPGFGDTTDSNADSFSAAAFRSCPKSHARMPGEVTAEAMAPAVGPTIK